MAGALPTKAGQKPPRQNVQQQLVDVRINNVSQLAGFAKRDDLVHTLVAREALAFLTAINEATEKAETLEDYLYSNQKDITPETIRKVARDVGGVTDIDTKYAPTLDLVKADIAMGNQLKVNQTPTFFINGERYTGEMTVEGMEKVIKPIIGA